MDKQMLFFFPWLIPITNWTWI